MAGETSSAAATSAWKRRLLALFVGMATVGLIAGLIVAFKPEDAAKSEGSALTTYADDKPAVPITPVTPVVDKPVEVTPVTPAITTTTTTTTQQQQQQQTGGTFASQQQQQQQQAAPSLPGAKVADALNNLASAVGIKPESSSPAAKTLQGFAAKASEQLAGALPDLGAEADAETFFKLMAAQETAGGCTPQTGLELRAMLEDPNGCTIITLVPGKMYNVAKEDSKEHITIASHKVVIGNPILLPTIDGSGCVRVFHVVAGGSLDLQFVRTFRGGGEAIATIPVLRGGSVLVEAGGRLSAFGVIFTHALPAGVPPILIAPDLSRALRVFGGQVCVMGGIVTITLSHFWTMQPGVMLRELYVVGAEMLTVAGVAVISGCTFTHSALFINGGGVGFLLAHLGGVLIASGMALTLNFMVVHAAGAGVLCFVGGGVAIFSGVTWTGNLGAYNHFGTGFNLFNGGGVIVMSGCVISTNLGVAAQSGTAIMISLGGGTLTVSGLAQDLVVGCEYYSGAGVLNWVGAGSAVLVGLSQSRSIGVGAVYGIGGTMAVGAGDLVVVGNTNVDNLGVASVVLIGGNYFLGAGMFVEIGSPLAKNAGVLFAVFLGFDAFVGAGAAVVAGTPASVNTGVVYLNKGASQYFINGMKVPANFAAFTVAGRNIISKRNKTRLLIEDEFQAAAQAVGGALQGSLSPQALSQIPIPANSFTVLDGKNAFGLGEPNDFVKAVRASPLGRIAEQQDAADKVNPPYANINGDVACNACGFAGDLATEFVGESAAACLAPGSADSSSAEACSLDKVAQTQAGGSLPSWAVSAAKLFDVDAGKLTGQLDTQVVTATLKVGCGALAAAGGEAAAAPERCVLPGDLDQAIKASLGSDGECARTNVVARQDLASKHPELGAEKLAAATAEAEALPNVLKTEVFDVAFTTHTPECAALVTDWVKGFDQAKLGGLPGADQAVAEYVGTHAVKGMSPAQASEAALPAVVSAMGGGLAMPAVLVSAAAGADDKATPAVGRISLPTLAQGQGAVVALTGFAKDKPVTFQVTSQCSALPLAAAAGAAEQVPVGQFTPTDRGAVNVPFTVPADLPKGTYALRAEQSGLGFCSQPFVVQ